MIKNLTIEKILWRGRGLGRLDSGKAVIVEPGVLPGETVDVQTIREKKDFIAAQPTEIVQPSPLRRPHPCPHAPHCGGCKMGILPASKALGLKKRILEETLKRSLHRHIDTTTLPSITAIASPRGWRYRYRGQIHVLNHKPHFRQLESSDPIRLDDCLLLARPLSRALHQLSAKLPDGRFTIAASPKDLNVFSQEDQTTIDLPFPAYGFDLVLPGNNFFQANWELNGELIDLVTHAVRGHDRVADLYAGAGNFSLPLATSGATILAVESVASAARAGARNAGRIGLNNLTFDTGNLAKERAWKNIRTFEPTAMVIDPPRTGAKHIGDKILSIGSLETMVWVSCDVVNTCRDLAPILRSGWSIRTTILVDMFPQTWHMETVFILKKH